MFTGKWSVPPDMFPILFLIKKILFYIRYVLATFFRLFFLEKKRYHNVLDSLYYFFFFTVFLESRMFQFRVKRTNAQISFAACFGVRFLR